MDTNEQHPTSPAEPSRGAPPPPPVELWGPAPPAPAPRPVWRVAVASAGAATLLTAGAMTGIGAIVTGGLPGQIAEGDKAGTTEQRDIEADVLPAIATDAVDWSTVADAVRPVVVAVEVRGQGGDGEGAGVVLDEVGNVLTNAHVVAGAQELRVTFDDGRVHTAILVGTDETTDLAVIQVEDPPADLVAATFGDSDSVVVGQPVMAVGNPLGLDATVTTGIVSAVDRPVTTAGSGREPVVTNAIQVDAAVNPGNSGGPLVDAAGRVIGITSSIAALSGGASGSIGLGFAIGSNLAERVAGELVTDGAAQHAYLGITLADATAEVDGVTRLGARVEQVLDGTPAAEAGLRTGDVIVAIDDAPVSGATALTAFVRERAVGQQVRLGVVRDGSRIDVEVQLAAREAAKVPKA